MATSTAVSSPGITGAVLAGGQGRRMGGQDKGLVSLRGRPLVAHVVERLAPQVDRLLVVANRNPARYRQYTPNVFSDLVEGFQGPLAGFATALHHASTDLVLCTPCDQPQLPPVLAARLLESLRTEQAEVAVAHDGLRLHPVICLLRKDGLPSLLQALAAEQRKVRDWLLSRRHVIVDFADYPDAFSNCNSPEELGALQGGELAVR